METKYIEVLEAELLSAEQETRERILEQWKKEIFPYNKGGGKIFIMYI